MTGDIKATGGNITDVNINGTFYRVHVFTEDGVFEVLDNSLEVDYLVVGGGGGGGFGAGAGGGAGGLLTNLEESPLVITPQIYPVIVGSGGNPGTSNTVDATSGTDSSFAGIVAAGGGGGGSFRRNGLEGGSGGGGGGRASALGGLGISGQGNVGGAARSGDSAGTGAGGGGGGAGGGGADGDTSNNGGDGGASIVSNITGSEVYFAGGGGGHGVASAGLGGFESGGNGAVGTSLPIGSDGVSGTGGGGGGGGWSTSGLGGSGASGVVIVRYVLQKTDGLFVSSNELVFGETFTATLTVVDAPDNTEVPYEITGIDSSDIDGFPLTGNFVITNEQATIGFTVTPSSKKSFTITANGFSETVNLIENIYGLAKLPESNSLIFTSEALSLIDLSDIPHVLEITILNTNDKAVYNLGASPSVLLALRSFITIDFASATSFNTTETLDFDPPQFWIGA